MPWLRTDDGPRKLRAVWLGPAGSTLPFQWTYVQWAVTLCAIPCGIGLLWLLLSALGLPVAWIWPFAVPWGGTAAVYLAVKVMGHVTFDEPLRYHQRLVRAEWSSRTSTRHDPRPVEVEWQAPPVGYLAEPVLAALGWTDAGQRPLAAHPDAAARSTSVGNPYVTAGPRRQAAVLDAPAASAEPSPTAEPSPPAEPAATAGPASAVDAAGASVPVAEPRPGVPWWSTRPAGDPPAEGLAESRPEVSRVG